MTSILLMPSFGKSLKEKKREKHEHSITAFHKITCIVSNLPLDGDIYIGRSWISSIHLTPRGRGITHAWRSIKDITVQRHYPIDHMI